MESPDMPGRFTGTNRTARARCSGLNLLTPMTPSPHGRESLRNPGRFTTSASSGATTGSNPAPCTLLGIGGLCPCCDEPITVDELLSQHEDQESQPSKIQ